MSPQKHYLDEPAVRIELSRVRFPKICPVCGAPASILSRITLSSRGSNYLNRAWDPYYTPSLSIPARRKLPPPKLRVIPIYVCENHYYTDEGVDRYKICCFIMDGFAMAFFVFGLMFLGDALNRGRPVPFWSVVFAIFFGLSMFLSWFAFRPNALERAVQILGYDPGMQNILIVFRSQMYRETVIKDNPMCSELVSWIVKPD